jgi:hypothetical protein
MNQPIDAPVALQQGNVQPVAGVGAGVRTILVTTLVNGAPTLVAMQAVSVADSEGHVLDFELNSNLLRALINEVRSSNTMLSVLSGLPYMPTPDVPLQGS